MPLVTKTDTGETYSPLTVDKMSGRLRPLFQNIGEAVGYGLQFGLPVAMGAEETGILSDHFSREVAPEIYRLRQEREVTLSPF